jgi:hypothetical protein
MQSTVSSLKQPRFRPQVVSAIEGQRVRIELGATRCAFNVETADGPAVATLIDNLRNGALSVADLIRASPEIGEQIPALLEDLSQLRLLVDHDPDREQGLVSGAQLYREVRRLADRVTCRVARSAFHQRLTDGSATAAQIIGYALEYHWIVKMAPGLIAPALASATSAAERDLLQAFLKSELGHDRFLAEALAAAGVARDRLETHRPVSSTFALCASLGVYARQHPLSFKAVLFLFEQAQPAFVDAFDARCRELGLPQAFFGPLREHAHLNEAYSHADISRDLLALEPVVDREAATVVKRHVAVLIETMVRQEEQILLVYGGLEGGTRLGEGRA